MKGDSWSFAFTPIHLLIISFFMLSVLRYFYFSLWFFLNCINTLCTLHTSTPSTKKLPLCSSSLWFFSLLPTFTFLVPSLRWMGWACRAAVSSVPWRCWGGQVPWSDWSCWGRLSVWVTSCLQFLPCSPSDIRTASMRAIPTEWASTRFKRQVFCAERGEYFSSMVSWEDCLWSNRANRDYVIWQYYALNITSASWSGESWLN